VTDLNKPGVAFRVWSCDKEAGLWSLMEFPLIVYPGASEQVSSRTSDLFQPRNDHPARIKWEQDGFTLAHCYGLNRYYRQKIESHYIAHPECTCGFHAHNTPERMMEYFSKISSVRLAKYAFWGLVAGAVLVGGNIAVHDRGVRSEAAEPLALLNTEDFSSIPRFNSVFTERVAKRYNVPLLDSLGDLEEYSKEKGQMIFPD
jgi:hypothetical protein